ncbi:histidine ammonia-lyase [Pullulanibacillus sp. KACC 23026]|uniref:histidine ammonia-lyase n=1 Tax=Pullulanibacillus sp. KACC 23026 TaxID=3028315 RepID=UPI0023AF46BB|nr:histidine ammonia-lyase [Pullulanibacillus sp. KACC 23026]WEG13834.1 histidine ammonia-lyase [Pullulanibacillus sp. KACC 23026]
MIELDGSHLTIKEFEKIVLLDESVKATDESWERVQESRRAVESVVENGQIVYGITTGFGKLSDVYIAREDVEDLQLNLIRSHACGVGAPFPEKVARGMLLLRANALLKGYSGVRQEVIERLLDLLNHQIHPVIPQQGSLGASGDLAPLAHLALVLIGEGEVIYKGERLDTNLVYDQLGWLPLRLSAKEGLALINGTQAMTSQGVINLLKAIRLARLSEVTAALTMEALEGVMTAFDEAVHVARGYQEQIDVARRMRAYLDRSELTTNQGEKRVQDAYSLRCIPQVHGASWQTIQYVKEKLTIEMNAATDNPLIFDGGAKIISGGNFHGQPIAFAMDFLKIGVAELANISERRIERLVNPQLNDLPPFLSRHPGVESGAMILQYTAASLVSENKTLAHPASVDSIPSSANQEDHVSMGTTGSRHCAQIIENVSRVLAIECFCALQALEFRDRKKLAPRTRAIYEAGRRLVEAVEHDRVFSHDIENIHQWFESEEWNSLLLPIDEE